MSDDEDPGYLDGYWDGDNQDVNQNDDKDPFTFKIMWMMLTKMLKMMIL